MKMRYFFLAGMILFATSIFSQEVAYARKVLRQLASDGFYGRGYVRHGNKKAADYIVHQLKKSGVQPLGDTYFQKFNYPMNTFPRKLTLKVDGKRLAPGEDYVVSCSSPAIAGDFVLNYLPDTATSVKTMLKAIAPEPDTEFFLVLPPAYAKLYGQNIPYVKGAVLLSEKQPYWHVSNGGAVGKTVWLKVQKEAFASRPDKITLNIKNKFIPEFQTQNIAAIIKGRIHPDTVVIFSAHYDHLGLMGKKAVYHGANDNGSGTSMLLDLARYYAQPEHRPAYSVAFLFFSGEEAGLKGSTHYVEHPLFPLSQIKLLINLDMVGTGSEGITVVNGRVYAGLYQSLKTMNGEQHYVKQIKARGASCNSDHCPFHKKGVKSIFIYTLGQEHRQYHIPEDDDHNFPFTAYTGLFRLLVHYVETL